MPLNLCTKIYINTYTYMHTSIQVTVLGHTQTIPMSELESISSYTDKDDLGRTRDTREEEQGLRE